MNSFFEFVISKGDQITNLLIEHIILTSSAIILAILIGVPLGIIISRVSVLRKPVIGFVNVTQAVPSMALLGLLIPFLGIGSKPAIFMVVVYSLLPIVKNTYAGISGIDDAILESAKGIGLTKNQSLFKIQIPLALPIIMAGLRMSAVTAVGLMTIAAFIGAGGLGYLVFSGVQTVNNNMILAGAIPSCLLALIVDFIFSKIETAVTPNGTKNKQKNKFVFKIIISIIIITILALSANSMFKTKKDTIVVGSKNFTEQLILGNMYADLIEDKTEYNVQRKLNLGGSIVTFNALVQKELDMYVEYTGTLLLNIMKDKPINDPEKCFEYVKKWLNENKDVELLDSIGFNNTYTLSMNPDVAKKYGIETISDLAKVSKDLNLSPTLEFENRNDCLIGLRDKYNIKFKDIKSMDGSLRYSAVQKDEAQVTDAFSTDGLLKKFDLKVLKDDKNFFSPYYAVPLVNKDTLKKYPELKGVIDILKNKITEETMIDLNYKVDVLLESPEDVAREFLVKEKLIK